MGDYSDSDIECISDSNKPAVSCLDVLVSSDSSNSVILVSDSPCRPTSTEERVSVCNDLSTNENGCAGFSAGELHQDTQEPWMALFGSAVKHSRDRDSTVFATPNPGDVAIALDDDFDPEVLFLDRSLHLSDSPPKLQIEPISNAESWIFSDNFDNQGYTPLFTPEVDKTPKRTKKPTLGEMRVRLSGKKRKANPVKLDLGTGICDGDPVSNGSTSVAATKKAGQKRKESEEEFDARQEEMAEKKRKKDEEKALKRAAKEERDMMRKQKKLEKETSKLERKAFKDAYRPVQGGKNSLNHLVAHVPINMFDAFGREELEVVLKEECPELRYKETDDPEQCDSICWIREHVTTAVERSEDTVALNRTVEHNREKHILIQIGKKSFVSMTDLQKQKNSCANKRETLAEFVTKWKKKFPDCRLYFFVYGMAKYFRNQMNNMVYGENRPARCKPVRKSIAEIPYAITYEDVENAMIDLFWKFNLQIDQIETPKEFARYLITMHKAVSDTHFKNFKRQQTLLFDAVSANTKTNGVTVGDDSLDGYKELWIRQLQQFMLISREVAMTIASLYGSPRVLLKAYDACASDTERERLLADLMVHRGTARRIGPKMSRLIYRYMCATDGNELLQ